MVLAWKPTPNEISRQNNITLQEPTQLLIVIGLQITACIMSSNHQLDSTILAQCTYSISWVCFFELSILFTTKKRQKLVKKCTVTVKKQQSN